MVAAGKKGDRTWRSAVSPPADFLLLLLQNFQFTPRSTSQAWQLAPVLSTNQHFLRRKLKGMMCRSQKLAILEPEDRERRVCFPVPQQHRRHNEIRHQVCILPVPMNSSQMFCPASQEQTKRRKQHPYRW